MTVATMKAAVLEKVGALHVREVARPSPSAGEVLVRVHACGVCGSDVPRVFEKGTYHFPCVPGHEFTGEVAMLGDGATGFAEGDRVAVFPLIPCGQCDACRREAYAQCVSYDYLGSRSDGAFAEYVCAPPANLLRVPAGVSFEEAAMTEPAAVARHALRRARPEGGETVAVFGAGPIGVMVAEWARIEGAARIFMIDVVDRKLEAAAAVEQVVTVSARDENPVERIKELTGGRGVDIAVEAAGAPATMIGALEAVANFGRVVLLGNPTADVTLPEKLISSLLRREVTVAGTWNSSISSPDNDWRAALDAMADGRLHVAPLITHRFALDGAPDALDMMRDGETFYNKVMIVPHGELGKDIG